MTLINNKPNLTQPKIIMINHCRCQIIKMYETGYDEDGTKYIPCLQIYDTQPISDRPFKLLFEDFPQFVSELVDSGWTELN